jgi:hypothetical protein
MMPGFAEVCFILSILSERGQIGHLTLANARRDGAQMGQQGVC